MAFCSDLYLYHCYDVCDHCQCVEEIMSVTSLSCMEENKQVVATAEAGIDLGKLVASIWKQRYLYVVTCTIGVIIGVVVAVSLPKTFESEVVLAPEVSSSSGLSSNLSELASMVGVDIGKGSGTSVDAIYPELYPEIVGSSPFVARLFDIRVSTQDGQLQDMLLYDYLTQHQTITWWDKAIGATVAFIMNKKPHAAAGKRKTNPLRFTEDEDEVAKFVRSLVRCQVDRKTSIITISTTAQDPLVAATLTDSVQRLLQEYVTEYRTKKSRADLEYTQKLFAEAKVGFEKAQQAYSAYADAHTDLMLESYITKRDELEQEMQLRYNIYNQLSQQVQSGLAKVQENTPAFTQIQPAEVPALKAGPKRAMIVLIWLLVAVFGTTVYALVKDIRSDKKSAA